MSKLLCTSHVFWNQALNCSKRLYVELSGTMIMINYEALHMSTWTSEFPSPLFVEASAPSTLGIAVSEWCCSVAAASKKTPIDSIVVHKHVGDELTLKHMVPISPTIHWFELALCKATFLLLVVSSIPLLTTISSRHGNSEPRWFFVVQNLWSMSTSTLSHGMHHTICSDTIGCNYPLKFNIDTQSRHIWREIHFPNHHFWYVKSWGVGLLVVQKVWSLTISEHPSFNSSPPQRQRDMLVPALTDIAGPTAACCSCKHASGEWKGTMGSYEV